MLKRKIDRKLQDWKATSHKALLMTGARQVGKSFSIRAFGRANYAAYAEINLFEDAIARRTLSAAANVEDFINRLIVLTGVDLVRGDSLVFIDEIQECPDIMTMAKFLVEDGRYSYAFSGSMLGTEFKHVRSFPVGYVDEAVMRPLDFEEFCWAIGVTDTTLGHIRACRESQTPVDPAVHEVMLRNFRTYVVVGGMPEVVQSFVDEGHSLARVRAKQTALNGQYAHDITKYAGNRSLQVKDVFERIPLELEEDSTRFTVSSLEASARYETWERDFLWLVNAGVALKTDLVTEAKAPLERTVRPSKFKLYQSDTGMLVSRYAQGIARAVYLDFKDPNLGGVYENVVAQEIVAAGGKPRYYMTAEHGEVDFVVEDCDGRVVPIEVKSGNKFRTHAALDRLLAVDAYKLREGIVFSRSNVEKVGKVLYLPFYMTICLADRLGESAGDFVLETVAL